MQNFFRLTGKLVTAITLVGSTAFSPAYSQDALSVQTTSGTVVGTPLAGVDAWMGLRYAKPPVGELRWRPPQAPVASQVPIKANALASSCAQNADLGVFAKAGGNEDCLYLNVYRDKNASQTGRKLPVFVWIHGGALQVGQGGDYDPSKLATRGKSLVVTLNYRLGVFGFLAHPSLDAEGHPSANYGLLDQQAALRWVHDNIEKFGGDAANVTIAGESSGGNSVMAHVASPLSAGLFHHVISMSGSGIMTRHPAFGAPRPLDVATQLGVDFAKSVGCESGGASCLRSLPTKQILDAQAPYLLNEFIIDGQVLPIHPADAYAQGRINHVTLVNGSTRDEGRFFVALPELLTGRALSDDEYPVWIARQYGEKLAPAVLKEYPLGSYENASEAFAAAATASMFACTGLALNRTLSDKIPVYAYEFSDRTAPSYIEPTSFPLLAAHTYELAYVFPGFRGGGNAQVELNGPQQKLSDEMVDFFFDAAALPSAKTPWLQFDPKAENFMTFALPSSRMVSGRFGATHHCAFWDQTGVY